MVLKNFFFYFIYKKDKWIGFFYYVCDKYEWGLNGKCDYEEGNYEVNFLWFDR